MNTIPVCANIMYRLKVNVSLYLEDNMMERPARSRLRRR